MLNHKCNLIVDSCCDLPYAMLNREGVELLKFPYIMSDGDHLDDMYTSLEPHAFYESIRKGEAPSTAQISMPTLLSAFNNAAASGVPTVFLCFSSGLSGTYDTACMALDQVKSEHPDADLYIVDTKLASIAEGMLVAEALRQRDNGLTAEELVAWAEEAVYYVGCLFMVEDLDSLARGAHARQAAARRAFASSPRRSRRTLSKSPACAMPSSPMRTARRIARSSRRCSSRATPSS